MTISNRLHFCYKISWWKNSVDNLDFQVFFVCFTKKLVKDLFSSFSSRTFSGVHFFQVWVLKLDLSDMDHYLKNFRVPVKPREGELPLAEPFDDGELGIIFKVSCPDRIDAIKKVIGEGIIAPQAPRLLFPSQLLSIFLSNYLDALQSFELLKIIVDDSIQPGFLKQGEMLKCVQKYNLGEGNGYILGIFPRWDLKHTKSSNIFDAFILALRNDDSWVLYSALQTNCHEMDSVRVRVLKDKYFSISFLLPHLLCHRPQASPIATYSQEGSKK